MRSARLCAVSRTIDHIDPPRVSALNSLRTDHFPAGNDMPNHSSLIHRRSAFIAVVISTTIGRLQLSVHSAALYAYALGQHLVAVRDRLLCGK